MGAMHVEDPAGAKHAGQPDENSKTIAFYACPFCLEGIFHG